MNTNAIQQQVASCCCENEKQAMQTRFENQQNHCATMQAIDKAVRQASKKDALDAFLDSAQQTPKED